ncbi:amidophosphoribosyltransferase [Coemansia aciculifera]|nr:amidophosphoribosyltransferase [Coemansia aciculifera]
MCGISALLLADSSQAAVSELLESLGLLQHRGQDAAGIVTCGHKGRLFQCKGNGMVRDVFTPQRLMALAGNMGVAHVRYPTAGTPADSEAQPFYVNSPYGIVMAHNGNLTNDSELRHFLDYDAHRHINTDSDSELLLNIFANNLQKTGKFRINEQDIFSAAAGLYGECRGAYAVAAMLAGFGIIGFRDPHGIRPLVFGRRKSSTAAGYDYMFASESVVLDALDFTDIEDVQPGEVVIVSKTAVTRRRLVVEAQITPCIFEYVYFARPDSTIDGIPVYNARLDMGVKLARKVRQALGDAMDIDVVIPEMRRKNVRRKLNAMPTEFKGLNVLLVDDSIVRGTTSQEIIQMARDVGARKVYFASAAPAIRFPNVYGIDMPSIDELVAAGRSDDDVAAAIGADMVFFQDLGDLIASCREFNPRIAAFDTSVFDGKYVTSDVTPEYLHKLEMRRNDAAKQKKPADGEVIGLHNYK